jgi:hypothetical protein
VYFIGHSAKTVFAECLIEYTRQKKTLGKDGFAECFFRHSAKTHFAECYFPGTRQNASLPSAFVLALGKEAFCRVHFFWPSANHFFKAIFEALNEFK